MCQELVHRTSTTNMVDYIEPVDTTPSGTTVVDDTPVHNIANPDGIDVVNLYPWSHWHYKCWQRKSTR